MAKGRDLKLEDYISETTRNIREDRALAKTLLIDTMKDMKMSETARKELGSVAAKYVENLQRSNEQMVRVAALIQKQKSQQFGLSASDKEEPSINFGSYHQVPRAGHNDAVVSIRFSSGCISLVCHDGYPAGLCRYEHRLQFLPKTYSDS